MTDAPHGLDRGLTNDGHRIRLSIRDKRIDLAVAPDEIARRLAGFRPPPAPARGYRAL